MNNSKIQILVCTDFSQSSSMAVMHAVKLAERLHARLHLCHIAKGAGLEVATSLGLNIPDEFPAAKQARVFLQEQLASLGPNIDGQVHVRMGKTVEGILSLIKELQPDMVVVCSHGKSLVQRALLGSVSRRLALRSPVPVLIIPTPGRELLRTKPEPPPSLELPCVGHAVGDTQGDGATGMGISGIGGADITYR